jgi:hypothetical protein
VSAEEVRLRILYVDSTYNMPLRKRRQCCTVANALLGLIGTFGAVALIGQWRLGVRGSDQSDGGDAESATGSEPEAAKKLECWRERDSSLRDSNANACINGALVPQMFILGCQKCGSTSLYFDMSYGFPLELNKYTPGGGVTTVNEAAQKSPKYALGKELHFFENNEHYSKGCQEYLGLMPNCPPKGYKSPAVVVDATPNYLFTTSVPGRVKAFYGPAASKLLFVILLREPGSRFLSYFKHAKVCESNHIVSELRC